MAYSKKKIKDSDKEQLAVIVYALQEKLVRKNEQLRLSRTKLNSAKTTMRRMKTALDFQRKRIVELHS